MDTLYAMPGHLMRRASQISTALFSDECGAFDLTSLQFAALHAIAENPLVDATRLSVLIVFDRSTIGDVLERMETKGWVERIASERGRRIKLVRLSPEGQGLLSQVRPAVQRVQDRLLAQLAEADRAMFICLLSTLADVHNGITAAPLRSAATE